MLKMYQVEIQWTTGAKSFQGSAGHSMLKWLHLSETERSK